MSIRDGGCVYCERPRPLTSLGAWTPTVSRNSFSTYPSEYTGTRFSRVCR